MVLTQCHEIAYNVAMTTRYFPGDSTVADFVAHLSRKNKSPRTLEAYGRDLEQFGRYLAGDRTAVSPGKVRAKREYPELRYATTPDISSYIEFLMRELKYTPRTARRSLSALKTFFRYLKREGKRDDNPALDVDAPEYERQRPKILQIQEVKSIIKARVERPGDGNLSARDRAIIELLYGSGVTRAELADLNLEDVDFRQRIAMVGNGNKRRMVPLTEACAAAMSSYLELRPASNDNAFFLSNRKARIGLRQVWKILKDYAVTVGIDKATTSSMRHSFAKHFIEGGGDLTTLQKILGHANIATTQVYADQSISDLRKAFQAANPRDKAEFEDSESDTN